MITRDWIQSLSTPGPTTLTPDQKHDLVGKLHNLEGASISCYDLWAETRRLRQKLASVDEDISAWRAFGRWLGDRYPNDRRIHEWFEDLYIAQHPSLKESCDEDR